MKVNVTTQSIELTKQESKKVATIGSQEYEQLLNVKGKFPDYKITVIERTTKKRANNSTDRFKGLTFHYMSQYVESHGTEEQKQNFKIIMTTDKEGLKVTSAPYGTIKKWFLAEFPAITEYQQRIANIFAHEPIA